MLLLKDSKTVLYRNSITVLQACFGAFMKGLKNTSSIVILACGYKLIRWKSSNRYRNTVCL